MMMRPDHRRVDRNQPFGVIAVAAALQPAQDPIPGPIGRPGSVPPVNGLPRPVRLGQVTPGRTSPSPPQDRVHHASMRRPGPTQTPRPLYRQQRLQQRPLLIAQIVTIMHTTITAEPESILCQTRPSAPRQVFAAYVRRPGGASRRSPRSRCDPASLPRRPCDASTWTPDISTEFLTEDTTACAFQA